jgi:hypothetical protein
VTNVCINFISSNQIHLYTANCVSQLLPLATDINKCEYWHQNYPHIQSWFNLKLKGLHIETDEVSSDLRCYSTSAVKQLLMFWKITAPVILVIITVHQTQIEHHIMAVYGLTWHFLQHKTFHSESSHIQWDEISIAINQNQCGVCFFHLIFTTVLVWSYSACTLYRKMQYFVWVVFLL